MHDHVLGDAPTSYLGWGEKETLTRDELLTPPKTPKNLAFCAWFSADPPPHPFALPSSLLMLFPSCLAEWTDLMGEKNNLWPISSTLVRLHQNHEKEEKRRVMSVSEENDVRESLLSETSLNFLCCSDAAAVGNHHHHAHDDLEWEEPRKIHQKKEGRMEARIKLTENLLKRSESGKDEAAKGWKVRN